MRNKVTANSNIWFNGKPATEYGVRQIEVYPEYNRPERKADIFEVPGRSGNVVFLQDAWNEIEKEYEIYTGDGSRGSVPKEFCNISEWLNSADGYARLEDTYEPEIFRLAYCLGAYETENALNRHGRATLTFNCRPERFLKSGEQPIEITASSKAIKNPTIYKAKPLFIVTCTDSAEAATIRVGNYRIFLNKAPIGETVFIDCETMNAYAYETDDEDEYTYNWNSYILVGDNKWPVLEEGTTNVYVSKPNYTIKMVPRWFYI